LGVRYAGGVDFRRFRSSYNKPSHFRRNFRPTRNDDVGLHCMFDIVRSDMNGRISLRKNSGYYQTKPTAIKLFHTQTSIQRVSLRFVMAALYL